MILVLGATGTTGGEVARQLIAGGIKPRLLVRLADKAKAFAGQAELVQGEIQHKTVLAKALVGVEKVYLVSPGVEGGELEIQMIDAAKKAGVKHVVKLSVLGADQPKFLFAQWHARSETARALGLGADPFAIPSVAGTRALVVDDWDVSAAATMDALPKEGIARVEAR